MSREKPAPAADPGLPDQVPAESGHAQPHGEAAPRDGAGARAPLDLIAIGNALARSEAAHFRDLAALAGAQASPMAHHDPAAGVPAPLLIFDEEPLAGAGPVLPDDEAADPLAGLLAEYRRALIHRERDQAHELKAIERAQIAMPLPEDPFLGTSGRYETGSLLGDLLGSQQNIDVVLGGMDTFGAGQLFAEDERHEILSLLAPARRQARALPQAAQLARHEHHLISVDSHFPMLVARTEADTDTDTDARAPTTPTAEHTNPSPEPQDDEHP